MVESSLTFASVRLAKRRNMALHRWAQLWKLRHSWSDFSPLHGTTRTARLTSGTETKHFIYFYLGHNAILLFKTQ